MASYLRAHTESPLWKFVYNHPTLGRGFEAPPGYSLSYMSCKHTGDAVSAARSMKENKDISGVLYSHFYPDPDDAVVIMPLRHYTLLVQERLDRP
jgi:hypothetical protein